MWKERVREIKGIALFSLGLLLLASILSYTPHDLAFFSYPYNQPAHNLVRIFGAYVGGILSFIFGYASLILPFIFIILALKLFMRGQDALLDRYKTFGLLTLVLSFCAFLSLLSSAEPEHQFQKGGLAGFLSFSFLKTYFGTFGSFIIIFALGLLSLILVFEVLVVSWFFQATAPLKKHLTRGVFSRIVAAVTSLRPKVLERASRTPTPGPVASTTLKTPVPEPKIKIAKPKPAEPASEDKEKKEARREMRQETRPEEYQLPGVGLLDTPPPQSLRQIKEDLNANARILEETLGDFGISAKVAEIEQGPAITRYELEPAPGVKLQRIVALSDDVALAMKAQSVRIVAPIPGKGRVGVEVPNTTTSMVFLKEVFDSEEFRSAESKLTLVLGKDITGQPVVADLGQMPHLLIAGTTGSGKTVCVNSLIMSILYRARPDEVKFLMVDPKMVELSVYNGLPHLLCPVVTETKKVSWALNWVVEEMERRYQLFAQVGVRNIEIYNQKQQNLPYIVVIIDELADLMVVAQAQIENAITRLAQLSRAVGIHIILATQRPSVDVITGVIKANFAARISFKVASKVDSRTVLDTNGADKLLGRGDMLFLRPGESKLIRAQGSFVKDPEIERVAAFIKNQAEPLYEEDLLSEPVSSFNYPEAEKDELFDEAVRLILEAGQASVSILQRRLRLGYTRAARLIDMMEQEGVVGPFQGSKPRKILVDKEQWLARAGKEVSSQEEAG